MDAQLFGLAFINFTNCGSRVACGLTGACSQVSKELTPLLLMVKIFLLGLSDCMSSLALTNPDSTRLSVNLLMTGAPEIPKCVVEAHDEVS